MAGIAITLFVVFMGFRLKHRCLPHLDTSSGQFELEWLPEVDIVGRKSA